MRKALVVMMGLIMASAAYAAPRYVAVPIATLGDARAINALGQVTGTVQGANGESRAFLYSDGVMTAIDVPGATASDGNAINASGHVVGCARIAGTDRAFVLRGGAIELLPETNGTNTVGCPVGINDAGYVVGPQHWSFLFAPAPSYRYFQGSFEDIPQAVAAINNPGDLAGYEQSRSMPQRAWAIIGGVYLSPLVSFGGLGSAAYAINDRAQVTGTAGARTGSVAYVYDSGAATAIPPLPGSLSSSGLAINIAGDVVGSALMVNNEPRAFLYAAGATYDLGARVESGLGEATLTAARGINDSGAIVANSCAPGPPFPAPCKAFLLTPVADVISPVNVPALSHLALALLALLLLACGVTLRR